MFSVDQLISECQRAISETEPRRAVKEVLQRAVSLPEEIASTLRPAKAGLELLHASAELTVIHFVWAPHMRLFPHDHRMWAAIGIYNGREDNEFFRRVAAGDGRITASGGKELTVGDVVILGDDVIHAVANPTNALTAAIHVYGGDFVNTPRSQWGPGPVEERPFDLDEVRRQFDAANDAWLRD